MFLAESTSLIDTIASVGKLEPEQTSLLKFILQITNEFESRNFLNSVLSASYFVGTPLCCNHGSSPVTGNLCGVYLMLRWFCAGPPPAGFLLFVSLHRISPAIGGERPNAAEETALSTLKFRTEDRDVSSAVCSAINRVASCDPTSVGHISSAARLQLLVIFYASSQRDSYTVTQLVLLVS